MAMNYVRAVLFDMGGTLEDLYYDEAIRAEATTALRELLRSRDLDPGLGLEELHAAVLSGVAAYQAWREKREVELPPEKVWTEFILAGVAVDKERLLAAAEELMFFYEARYYVRSLRREAPAVLEALRVKGYRLAIISNVMSRGLVPARLAEYGIAHYFDPVVTSVDLGWRKPNARIFQEAARLLGLPPEACAYVGDTVSRDVAGARRARYGQAIQIRSFLTEKADRGVEITPPDAVVENLMEIVDLVSRSLEVASAY
jgi:putative hydrolase of the HAD superfamily